MAAIALPPEHDLAGGAEAEPVVPLAPPRRVLLVVNPVSRRGERLLSVATSEFRRLGVRCDVARTRGPGDYETVAMGRGPAYDAVFALGGDGTAIDVLSALAGSDTPAGILPGGTGNLVARALGIPLTVRRAVRALMGGVVTRIDLGRLASGRRFAIGVGIGIDASMIANVSVTWKQRAGLLAYLVAGWAAVLRRERFAVDITVDGVTHRRHAAAVVVANIGTLLHGLVTLGPGIGHRDGILDVCVFDPQSFVDSLRIMRKLVFRDFRPDPALAHFSGRTITVASDPARPAQADGELIGAASISVVAEPRAGCIIVPRRGWLSTHARRA